MKKKVLMLLSNHFNPDPRVYKEAKSLVKAGYDVTILCWDRQLKYKEREDVEGIHVERIRLKAGYGFKAMILKMPVFWIKLFFRALKKDFDIVHSHDFDTAVVGYLLKIFKRKKWVYDSHDLYFTYFIKGYKKTILYKITENVNTYLAKKCNLLIVPTESFSKRFIGAKEYYQKKGIKNIIVIMNVPVLTEFLRYRKINFKNIKGVVIGSLGSIRNLPAIIILLKTIQKLGKHYSLLIVGGGKNLDKLKEVHKTQYSNVKITFIPEQPYKLIPNYYKLCDIIFSVYKDKKRTEKNINEKTAIQTKVFEAAILGIPSIVPDYVLEADFVRKYKCGCTVKDLKVKYLIKAIRKCEKIKINTKPIREKWKWENEEKKLVKAYEALK